MIQFGDNDGRDLERPERAVDLYLKVGRKFSETWCLPKPDLADPKVTILDKTHLTPKAVWRWAGSLPTS
ncbi:MAG: hypothetical protein ABIO94_04385 [Opitutaceae bacterium]